MGTTFAGTVGLSTGMTVGGGGWAVSIDARANPGTGTQPTIQAALEAASNGATAFPLLPRQSLEACSNYSCGVSMIGSSAGLLLIAPGYFILAGSQQGEGAVITRNASAQETDIWPLDAQGQEKSWYRVETNYDHWEAAPENDDRRDPADISMDALGQENLDLIGLWEVLSSPPVLNSQTLHTDLCAPKCVRVFSAPPDDGVVPIVAWQPPVLKICKILPLILRITGRT